MVTKLVTRRFVHIEGCQAALRQQLVHVNGSWDGHKSEFEAELSFRAAHRSHCVFYHGRWLTGHRQLISSRKYLKKETEVCGVCQVVDVPLVAWPGRGDWRMRFTSPSKRW